jgi:nitrate reductase NapAB chaperone NapD
MIIASGFLEVIDISEVQSVINQLKDKNVEVTDLKDEKIVFLIERTSSAEVKRELESLKDIDGVKNVYLSYFSLEETSEGSIDL